MKQNKTQRTDNSVSLFLDQIEPEQKRKDSYALVALMSKITAEEPKPSKLLKVGAVPSKFSRTS